MPWTAVRAAADSRWVTATPPPAAPGRLRRHLPHLPPWAGHTYTVQTAATVVSALGNSGALIASAFAVLRAGGSGTDVGLVSASRALPLVVFLLVGGAVADRVPRHRLMAVANSANAVSQAAFGVLVLSGSAQLWQMMLLSAAGGTALAFFTPASQGVILASVEGEHAGQAFAAYRIGVNAANIGGAALGGALVAAAGPGWVLVIDGASFAVAATLRAGLRLERTRETGSGVFQDLREGWREFVSRSWLWGIVAQFSVVNALFVATESVYGPLVAESDLGGARPWGVALAAWGVGTLAGGLMMMRWKPRRMLLAGTLGIFPLALPMAALAVPVAWQALCLATFAAGVGVEVFGVSWMLTLRQEIPDELMARVTAYDWLGSLAFAPVGTALAGPAADACGIRTALWSCAAGVVALTAAVLVLPEVRRLSHRDRVTGGPAPSPLVPAADDAAP
jgi:MFS family permease